MAIGTANSDMVSTADLEVGMQVTIDHEQYTVTGITREDHNEVAVVDLEPEYGTAWGLQVDLCDWDEPMWERS